MKGDTHFSWATNEMPKEEFLHKWIYGNGNEYTGLNALQMQHTLPNI